MRISAKRHPQREAVLNYLASKTEDGDIIWGIAGGVYFTDECRPDKNPSNSNFYWYTITSNLFGQFCMSDGNGIRSNWNTIFSPAARRLNKAIANQPVKYGRKQKENDQLIEEFNSVYHP